MREEKEEGKKEECCRKEGGLAYRKEMGRRTIQDRRKLIGSKVGQQEIRTNVNRKEGSIQTKSKEACRKQEEGRHVLITEEVVEEMGGFGCVIRISGRSSRVTVSSRVRTEVRQRKVKPLVSW